MHELTSDELLVAAKHAREWKEQAKSMCETNFECKSTGFP